MITKNRGKCDEFDWLCYKVPHVIISFPLALMLHFSFYSLDLPWFLNIATARDWVQGD